MLAKAILDAYLAGTENITPANHLIRGYWNHDRPSGCFLQVCLAGDPFKASVWTAQIANTPEPQEGDSATILFVVDEDAVVPEGRKPTAFLHRSTRGYLETEEAASDVWEIRAPI